MFSAPVPFALCHNTLALYRGVAFNPDDIGIVDNPVTDGIDKSRVVQILVPARNIELKAECCRGCFHFSEYC